MESLIETPSKPQVGQPGANRDGTLFQQLMSLFSYDPCSEWLEPVAADLAAHLSGSKGVCVTVIKSNALGNFFGVLNVLEGFGVVAEYRNLINENGRLIFLSIDLTPPPSEFEEATVKARYVRRAVAA